MSPAAAVIVAGGRGSRMGGRDKPALLLDGRTLLQIALGAVGHAVAVVVGPPRELPPGVRSVLEDPPGAGPAAAVAAGVAALSDLSLSDLSLSDPASRELAPDALVAVLAADLPGITEQTVNRLCAAASGQPGGALLVDASGRRQYLTGVWRLAALTSAIATRHDWTGRPLRELLAPLAVCEVAGSTTETADVDTEQDWNRWRPTAP